MRADLPRHVRLSDKLLAMMQHADLMPVGMPQLCCMQRQLKCPPLYHDRSFTGVMHSLIQHCACIASSHAVLQQEWVIDMGELAAAALSACTPIRPQLPMHSAPHLLWSQTSHFNHKRSRLLQSLAPSSGNNWACRSPGAVQGTHLCVACRPACC